LGARNPKGLNKVPKIYALGRRTLVLITVNFNKNVLCLLISSLFISVMGNDILDIQPSDLDWFGIDKRFKWK
jgi:hypothetical protein